MSKVLDTRIAEDAEPIRIIIYPNTMRQKQPDMPEIESMSDKEAKDFLKNRKPEYEYYDKLVITYEIKDKQGNVLTYKKSTSELGLSDDINDIKTIQSILSKDLKDKVKEDILTLIDKNIDSKE